MLISTDRVLCFVAMTLLTIFPNSCAGKAASEDGAIKIIEPKSGYVITPINFENYRHGDPAEEMNFILQGNPKLNGKVNVTLIWNKDNNKKVKLATQIPVINGEAEAPITVPIWKLKSGDYTLKAAFYRDTGKPIKATQKVKVKLPNSAKNGQKAAGKPEVDADEVETTGEETEPIEPDPPANKPPQRRIKRMVEKGRLNVRDHR